MHCNILYDNSLTQTEDYAAMEIEPQQGTGGRTKRKKDDDDMETLPKGHDKTKGHYSWLTMSAQHNYSEEEQSTSGTGHAQYTHMETTTPTPDDTVDSLSLPLHLGVDQAATTATIIEVTWAQAIQLVEPILNFHIRLTSVEALQDTLRPHIDSTEFLADLLTRRPTSFAITSVSRTSYKNWISRQHELQQLSATELEAIFHFIHILRRETLTEIQHIHALDTAEIRILAGHVPRRDTFEPELAALQLRSQLQNESQLHQLIESALTGPTTELRSLVYTDRWQDDITQAVIHLEHLLLLVQPTIAGDTTLDLAPDTPAEWHPITHVTKTKIIMDQDQLLVPRTSTQRDTRRRQPGGYGTGAGNVFRLNETFRSISAAALAAATKRQELIRYDYQSVDGHPQHTENILIIRERTYADSYIFLSQYLLIHDFRPASTLQTTLQDLIQALSLIGYASGDDKLTFDNGLELDLEYAEARYHDGGWALLRNYKSVGEINTYILKLKHRALFGHNVRSKTSQWLHSTDDRNGQGQSTLSYLHISGSH